MFSFKKATVKSNNHTGSNSNTQMDFIKDMNEADVYKKVKKANRLQKRISSAAK
jgi:hypothetical protein